MENPYQAPQSHVEDPEEPRKPKPSAVRRAILVFWIGWGLGLVLLLPGVTSELPEGSEVPAALIFGLQAVFAALTAWLIVMTSRGRNWARWVLVIYVALTWSVLALDPSAFLNEKPLAVAIQGFVLVLDVYGCILLLFGAGAEWFRRPGAAGA